MTYFLKPGKTHLIPTPTTLKEHLEIKIQRKLGEVLEVKPFSALAMIDEGELDWKIVAISLDDPKASLVKNDFNDVEKHFPMSSTTIYT
ncbi:Soluble inorganic pyrophosphatase 6, chloroplastic [Stylosanthes scabra]|uniref:inorganic diphosphatase n=1 Tax=Stylosanthes scabra TaxID=79078 RepID=A0ABU6U5H3_9FABA|nr:Soluble inorganic pyrophosphatase 6, chloroplastic [Stylosanthes scabra]